MGQFLSPATNHRTDRFGGSLENRLSFALMVFERMREEVGDSFLLGFRQPIVEGAGGLQLDDSIEIALRLQRSGMVDFYNAMSGSADTEKALSVNIMPGMESPIAPWLSSVGDFKREISMPVFHAARISDVATARHAIREGLLDMVAMTRAHIADPHIVKKIIARQEDTICPCVGATHCQSSTTRPHCLHNPASGRELVLPHVVGRTKCAKRVVVVGGGPAGLEAARVCAERGHKVVILRQPNKLAANSFWRLRPRGDEIF
ncbi:FAD-binding protein [Burkholderia anthina]|uniref:oxidoreductase n=1 Tax=Burkholderia anthina TaxID=179879 RepID=UPI0024419235|nr:FAD-binding protein [Burkholderia anthina]